MLNHLEQLLALNLPTDQYAVFGSGPLAVRGWRENDDIDIVVSQKLWQELIKQYSPTSPISIKLDKIEIFNDWRPWFDSTEELIGSAELIDGIRYVNLDNVLKWKQAMGREKDLKDIKLINHNRNK